MPFDHIRGQDAAIGILKRALLTQRVHHSMRFEGPEGVGRELTALAVAQALVCSTSNPLGCGTCSACRRVVQQCEDPVVPLHPDVILVGRGVYPPRLIHRTGPEAQEISVQQIRHVVLEHAAFPPHEGKARVFIVRRAEELSTSAANALLKTLEEPGSGTHFILTVSNPERLPETIRSRTLRVRFAPLSEQVLADILVQHDIDRTLATEVARLADGSAARAFSLADEESAKQRREFVSAVMTAIDAPTSILSLDIANEHARNRDELRVHLRALASDFALHARRAALDDASHADTLASRFQVVLHALRDLDRNASLAMLVEQMMLRLRAQPRTVR